MNISSVFTNVIYTFSRDFIKCTVLGCFVLSPNVLNEKLMFSHGFHKKLLIFYMEFYNKNYLFSYLFMKINCSCGFLSYLGEFAQFSSKLLVDLMSFTKISSVSLHFSLKTTTHIISILFLQKLQFLTCWAHKKLKLFI